MIPAGTSPDSEMPIEVPQTQRPDQAGFPHTELLIGLAAVAGLTLGYLIAKRRG